MSDSDSEVPLALDTYVGYEEATWRRERAPGRPHPYYQAGMEGFWDWRVGPAQVVCQLGEALVFLPTRRRV